MESSRLGATAKFPFPWCWKGAPTVFATAALLASSVLADEGGRSFWLPGQYESFAAIATEPGSSLPMQSYNYSSSVAASTRLDAGGEARFGLDTQFFSQFIASSWTPNFKLFGAQPSFSRAFYPGWNELSENVGIGPLSTAERDSVTGFGDLYPTAQLFWDGELHNWMAYVTGVIPVGSYDPNRLANLMMGHGAIDIGGAYTYLDTATVWEFSATAGVTYNFENPDTECQSGIDAHLDLGMSRFLNERFFVGPVVYPYMQLTHDEGQPAALGDFKSQTYAIGPQIGYNYSVGDSYDLCEPAWLSRIRTEEPHRGKQRIPDSEHPELITSEELDVRFYRNSGRA